MVTVASEWSDAISFKVRKAGTSFSEILKINSPHQTENASFGTSMAINSDASILLATSNDGSSYGVNYYKKVGNSWEFHSRFKPTAEQSLGPSFGGGIALNAVGDYALIADTNAVVDGITSGIVYIYTRIEDTWTFQGYLKPEDLLTGDIFGVDIALTNDAGYAFIGSSESDRYGSQAGKVYIFKRSGSEWKLYQKLYPDDLAPGDEFGRGLSVSGDGQYLFACSVKEDTAGSDVGSVYVFKNLAGVWVQLHKITPPDPEPTLRFGNSTATNEDGTILIVGARFDDGKAVNAGSFYFYTRTGAQWTLRQKLYASDSLANDHFGIRSSITKDGTLLFVSAYSNDGSAPNTGAIYVFDLINDGLVHQQKIAPKDGSADDNFGNSTALNSDGTILAVGCIYDDETATNSGSVYVYIRQNHQWILQQKLYASDPAVNVYFSLGLAISSDGSYILIGAVGNNSSKGSVYVFLRNGNVWTQQTKLVASDGLLNNNFGHDVCLNADATIALIGAPDRDDNGLSNSGCVYVFTRTGTTWTQQQKIYAPLKAANDRFGIGMSMNAAGDYALIASYARNDKGTNAGVVFGFSRSVNTWTHKHTFYPNVPISGEGFGVCIALNAIGDFALIGGHNGNVYVFTRIGDTWTQRNKLYSVTNETGEEFGRGVALTADAKLAAIGAPRNTVNGVKTGSVYILTNPGESLISEVNEGLMYQTKLQPNDLNTYSLFGASSSMNSRGDRLIIGASTESEGVVAGAAYIYDRFGDTWIQSAKIEPSDGVAGDVFGRSVAMNGDGTVVLVGSRDNSEKASKAGAVYMFKLENGVWVQKHKFFANDFGFGHHFGGSCALSSDGTIALIGAFDHSEKGYTAGAAYYFTYDGETWTQRQKFFSTDITTGDQFGSAVSINETADYAVIGAMADGDTGKGTGSVYFFTRSGLTWTQVGKLASPSSAIDAQFGSSLCLTKDKSTLLVGARGDTGNTIKTGKVYQYTNVNNTWRLEKTYQAFDGVSPDGFGSAVSINDQKDLLLIGAYSDNDFGTYAGSIYVYANPKLQPVVRFEEGMQLQTKILPVNGVTDDRFGRALALTADGKTAFIGSDLNDDIALSAGCVSIYNRIGDEWIFEQKLYADDGVASDRFGYSLAVSSNGVHLLVGAVNAPSTTTKTGRIYYFKKVNGNWIKTQTFTSTDSAISDAFGTSVSMNAVGDYAIVGAVNDDDKGADSGSVYVFIRSGDVWRQSSKLTAADGVAGDQFGRSVSLNSVATIALISAHQRDDNSLSGSGVVYYYTRSGATWTQQQKIYPSDPKANISFGESISMNKDGTLAYIASVDNAKGPVAGAVYIFRRSGNVWTQQQKLTPDYIKEADYYGSSVAINSDGTYVMIAALSDDEAGNDFGGVYVYSYPSRIALSQSKESFSLQGFLTDPEGKIQDYYGRGIALSEDGTWAAVGVEFRDDNSLTNSGCVYIYKRKGQTWIKSATLYANPVTEVGIFGWASALDADGTQLLVGEVHDGITPIRSGAVHYYTRVGEIWTHRQKFKLPTLVAEHYFGSSVALNAVGDYAVIGAYNDTEKGALAGAVFIYKRVGLTWTYQSKMVSPVGETNTHYGIAAAMNQSGSVLAVGANGSDSSGVYNGAVYLYDRNGEVWNYREKILPPNLNLDNSFGIGLALNKEGTLLLVGSTATRTRGNVAGTVYIYRKEGSSWSMKDALYISNSRTSDEFGRGVAMTADGKLALIGAVTRDEVVTDQGVVYIFADLNYEAPVNAIESWREQEKLYAKTPVVNSVFGTACALSHDGKTAVITAENGPTGHSTDAGCVYFFEKTELGWVEKGRFWSEDTTNVSNFGRSIDLFKNGTYAVVGAPSDGSDHSGSVFVFMRVGDTWIQTQKIRAQTPSLNHLFGTAVSASEDGSILLIGEQSNGVKATEAGACHVYTNQNGQFVYQQTLYASDAAQSDYFGMAAAISGDGNTALIGAGLEDSSASNSGSIYVFTRSGDVWTEQQKLVAFDGMIDDWFGSDVALNYDGTIALIVCQKDDDKGTNTGSVYVYSRSGSVWTYVKKLYVSDPVTTNAMSYVAVSGDSKTVMIGSSLSDDKGTDTGAVYVFGDTSYKPSRLNYEGLIEYTEFYPKDGKADASNFGMSCALSHDAKHALIGAGWDSDKGTKAGAVYYYIRENGTWIFQEKFHAPDGISNDDFGISVALNADASIALVGALNRSYNGVLGSGSVYVFSRTNNGWVYQQKLTASDRSLHDAFGFSLALNANGDYALIGSGGRDDGGIQDRGAVYIFTRSGNIWTQQSKIMATDAATSDSFGSSVSVNADATIAAIGAYNDDDNAASNSGSVYIFTRSGSTWTQQQKLTESPPFANNGFGIGLSLSPDSSILAISSFGNQLTPTRQGCLYLYRRAGTTYGLFKTVYAKYPSEANQFGRSIALSYDGSFMLVGDEYNDIKANNCGSVVFFSTRELDYADTNPSKFIQRYKVLPNRADSVANLNFGRTTSVSADGIKMLVSAPHNYPAANQIGEVFYFKKINGFWEQQQKFTSPDGVLGDAFGYGVTMNAAGDYALVGAPNDDPTTNRGSVYVYKLINDVWTYQSKFYSSRKQYYFGSTIGLNAAGDYAAITDPGDTGLSASGGSGGVIYIFTRTGEVWTEQQIIFYKEEANPSQTQFGNAVSINADATWMVVGFYHDDIKASNAGAALIYHRTGTKWTLQQKLYAPDPTADVYFGSACAINAHGNAILISATPKSDLGMGAGVSYLFTRLGGTWTYRGKVYPDDAVTGQGFGGGTSFFGDDHFVVGSIGDNEYGHIHGSAYIFENKVKPTDVNPPSGLSELYNFASNEPQSESWFGRSSAMNATGDYALVGESHWNNGAIQDLGRVHVYQRTGKEWNHVSTITAPDGVAGDYFGVSVAVNADATTALIGAFYRVEGGIAARGAVYVYTRSGSTWTYQQKILASNSQTNDQFGICVAVNSDATVALIGAVGRDDGSVTDRGGIYYFTRSGSTWTQQSLILFATPVVSDVFGSQVALNAAGDYALIAAYGRDSGGFTNNGVVYIYTRSGTTWSYQGLIAQPDPENNNGFSSGVALNADATIALIGAGHKDENGLVDSGVFYLYTRSGSTWTYRYKIQPNLRESGSVFGYGPSLNAKGDIALIGSIGNKFEDITRTGAVYFLADLTKRPELL